MLWGDWNVCAFETLCLPLDKISCTRQFESELSLHSLASLFPLKEGSTSHLGLLPSGKKRETALLGARNRFALRLADHQRSSPCYAGWDRRAVAGGDLMLHQSLRHVMRDGTAWLKMDRIIEVLVL